MNSTCHVCKPEPKYVQLKNFLSIIFSTKGSISKQDPESDIQIQKMACNSNYDLNNCNCEWNTFLSLSSMPRNIYNATTHEAVGIRHCQCAFVYACVENESPFMAWSGIFSKALWLAIELGNRPATCFSIRKNFYALRCHAVRTECCTYVYMCEYYYWHIIQVYCFQKCIQ